MTPNGSEASGEALPNGAIVAYVLSLSLSLVRPSSSSIKGNVLSSNERDPLMIQTQLQELSDDMNNQRSIHPMLALDTLKLHRVHA